LWSPKPESTFGGNIVSAPATDERPEPGSTLKDFRLRWRLMNAYEPFERVVVLALALIIAAIIVKALLALSRKFVIFDSAATPAATIAALGFATLVLGFVCWLLRERASNDVA
jgi:uncharacterized membrane protein (DUF373 family)